MTYVKELFCFKYSRISRLLNTLIPTKITHISHLFSWKTDPKYDLNFVFAASSATSNHRFFRRHYVRCSKYGLDMTGHLSVPKADEFLAAISDNVRRYHQAGIIGSKPAFSVGFEEGLAAYLAGKHEKGLALIATAAEDGYFILPKEAYLRALYDDPGFAPILARQEARQARERNRFLSIVCTDNPYAAVWEPAEGTCERFAAEGVN